MVFSTICKCLIIKLTGNVILLPMVSVENLYVSFFCGMAYLFIELSWVILKKQNDANIDL